jgi:hypothetical protein
MARTTPHVLSTRLTRQQLAQVVRHAEARGLTVSEFSRHAITALAKGTAEDAAGTLAELVAALALPSDASPEQVLDAVSALVEELTAPEKNVDPMGEAPDPPPLGLSRMRLRIQGVDVGPSSVALSRGGEGSAALPPALSRATPAQLAKFKALRAERAAAAKSRESAGKQNRERNRAKGFPGY